MAKIRTIELTGFRGARHPLVLDLTDKSKSVAVFGDNGGGKSTLTDAVEWFFNNRVEHLWREDCQAEALRNVTLRPEETTSVVMEFTGGPPKGTRTLDGKLSTKLQPNSSDLANYLKHASGERLILRSQELMHFVSMRKGDKRKYVASIIGYEAVTTFRDTIQQTLNALKSTPDYVAAKKTIDSHSAELLKQCGEIITTPAKYFDAIDTLLKPFELSLESPTKASVAACEATLKGRIRQEEKAKRKLKLKTLSTKLGRLETALESLATQRDGFQPKYDALIQNVGDLKDLHLAEFLKKGKSVLEHGDVLGGRCPFCLTEKDLDELGLDVDARIEKLEQIQLKYAETTAAMREFVAALNEVSRLCGEAHGEAGDSPCTEGFISELSNLGKACLSHAEGVPASCAAFKAVTETEHLIRSKKAILDAIIVEKTAVIEAEAKEILTHEEESIVEALATIRSVTEHFDGHQKDSRTIKAFETQIRSLQTIFDEFVKVQTTAMQNALNIMSKDIGRFYDAMHPSENADEVHLTILGDEGVEFRYKFHGTEVHPPMKYLSESHLNSLGIALFLASVKLFNTQSRFFILDDIISSFDVGHRRRLLRLLKAEFTDWQIILLTHEQVWFELIRRELRPDGWILKEVQWDETNGTMLRQSPADFREFIEQKRQRKEDIENDLRKLLEQNLKELCHNLEVKVAFLFNEVNEKRTPGELLSALQGAVNKKCSTLKGHAVFAKLDGSAFLANIGSHDNSEQLSAADIELILQDIDELDALFRCSDCNVVTSTKRFAPTTKTVSCKCGKHAIPWKE